MPFNSYATAADVAIAHRIRLSTAEFVAPAPIALNEYFRSEVDFTLRDVSYRVSEAAVCETLIYPVLREVWRLYLNELSLWSHLPLAFDPDLCGTPDYMVSRRSPLGAPVPDQPFLLVVEAKKDDFDRGWGQCLSAMRAAQGLCEEADLTFSGASTNGRTWEFGRIEGDVFLQDPRPFSILDLHGLSAALHDIMIRCRDQAARLPAGV